MPFDHGGTKLRRQGSNLRLAINSRASYRSTTPERHLPRELFLLSYEAAPGA